MVLFVRINVNSKKPAIGGGRINFLILLSYVSKSKALLQRFSKIFSVSDSLFLQILLAVLIVNGFIGNNETREASFSVNKKAKIL